MSSDNPFREKNSRTPNSKTPVFTKEGTNDGGGPVTHDPYVKVEASPGGKIKGYCDHPDDTTEYYSYPNGTSLVINKNGETSIRCVGETRMETHGFTLGVSDNVDVAAGGLLTVKTVGGLEAQISGDGNITIGGATLINILGDAGISVKGNATISAGGSASVDAAGISLSSSAGIAIGAAGGISLQAGGGIKMQEGGAGTSGYMGGGNEG